ncbi:elongator complex protein 5-like isoform X4 [Zonotrichia leucophrys gambelii]|uniref:elongator complex protein 5-like isoform X4 n=1 Tax=Zonotrichia leucophrys gambelii TaxID=257770 RepID=UPI0031404A7F
MLETLGGRGLLLVRDSADSEGRSLLRAIVSEAVNRAEQVLVVLLEVPREQFQEGLSPHVRERLHFRDLFAPTLVLDSLSWALLREPLPHLCRHLGALLTRGGPRNEPPPRIVALLHQDLHPPPVLGALGGLARAQLILGGPPETPGAPRRLRLLRDPQKRGGPLQETLTLLPDGSLGGPPPPDPSPNWGDPKKPQNAPNVGVRTPLTFRLGLSGAEQEARAALTLPYLPRAEPEAPPEDLEDPDEDLEL